MSLGSYVDVDVAEAANALEEPKDVLSSIQEQQ